MTIFKSIDNRSHYERLITFAIITLVCGITIFGRLVWIQLYKRDEIRDLARGQGRVKKALHAPRGKILDMHGRVLADNRGDYVKIGINPYTVANPKRLAKEFAEVLERDENAILAKSMRSSGYVELARKVSPEQVGRLRELGWNFESQSDEKRVYPYGSLLAQALGFTSSDDEGLCGLEMVYDDLLRGDEGWRVERQDLHGKSHLEHGLPHKPPRPGGDIFLTVDIDIQSILEEELQRALREHSALKVSGIVMNPSTGAIRAAASLPSFDPNHYGRYSTSLQKCNILTDVYEPGSTFKIIAASLLLEKGLADSGDVVDCSKSYVMVYGHPIHDLKRHGMLSLKQVIVQSSNVGMVKFTQDLSKQIFYDHICKFGFLGRTGIELNGEVSGSLPVPSSWSGTKRPTVAIGQGVSVTMLQMALAYATIANSGKAVSPTMIKGIDYQGGGYVPQKPVEVRRVLTERTAAIVEDMLIEAVEHGTGTQARIPGLAVAGKTSTAQKPDLINGGYLEDKYIGSFIGYFGGKGETSHLILIAVDEPERIHTGGRVAAPVFKRVAERIIGLYPEILLQRKERGADLVRFDGAAPDLRSLQRDEAASILKEAGFRVKYRGRGGMVYDQSPEPGAKVQEGAIIELTVGPAEPFSGDIVVVPVLTELSLRDAILKATEAGLEVSVHGSGRVVRQSPESGARVKPGDKCELIAHG